MYDAFYKLTALPFENTPDPRFFYASEQHREALAAIEYTIRMRKGFVLITGDIGSGKTTVGRTTCERCHDQATIVQVLHGHHHANGIVGQICRKLGIRIARGDDHGRMLEKLQQYLADQVQRKRPVVLLVDEAQTLSDEAIEELRLLSNFDSSTQKLIQIVMIGQPELRDRIREPQHSALRQRIVLAKQLWPLSLIDTRNYIEHRLRAASEDPEDVRVSFADEAIAEVYQFTGGIPRLINVTCDNCLLLGMVREVPTIDPAMVYRVMQDMVPQLDDVANETPEGHPLRMAG